MRATAQKGLFQLRVQDFQKSVQTFATRQFAACLLDLLHMSSKNGSLLSAVPIAPPPYHPTRVPLLVMNSMEVNSLRFDFPACALLARHLSRQYASFSLSFVSCYVWNDTSSSFIPIVFASISLFCAFITRFLFNLLS